MYVTTKKTLQQPQAIIIIGLRCFIYVQQESSVTCNMKTLL